MTNLLLVEWGLTPYDLNRKPRPVVSTIFEAELLQMLALGAHKFRRCMI
jgi:hypothetical protein